jgi:hypothetical protein
VEVMKKAAELLADEPCRECPFNPGCRYLEQRKRAADVWIVAHTTLFQEAPRAIGRRGVARLIVDETAWISPIVEQHELPLDQLDYRFIPVGEGLNGERLADIRAYFKSAAARLDDNQRITRAHLEAVGFDRQTGAFAAREEWHRQIPGKVGDERLESNRSIWPLTQVWLAVIALFKKSNESRASGWLKVTRRQDGARVISITGRRRIHEDFAVPTLLIAAGTAQHLANPEDDKAPEVTAATSTRASAQWWP